MFLDTVIVGQSLRGQENSEKEDEATALQRILRNPQEQYWQQSRGDYSCFTECSKLLLSQDKRHSIINPLCQCYTKKAKDRIPGRANVLEQHQQRGQPHVLTNAFSSKCQTQLTCSFGAVSGVSSWERKDYIPGSSYFWELSSLLSTCGTDHRVTLSQEGKLKWEGYRKY